MGGLRGGEDLRLKSRILFAIVDGDLSRDRAKAALDRLISRGWIMAEGGRGGRQYTLIAVGEDGPEERDLDDKESEDDDA